MRCSMWLVIEPYLTACRVCTAEPLCCGQGCCSRIQNQEQEFSHSLLRSTSIQQDVTVFTELHSTARESCQIGVKHWDAIARYGPASSSGSPARGWGASPATAAALHDWTTLVCVCGGLGRRRRAGGAASAAGTRTLWSAGRQNPGRCACT